MADGEYKRLQLGAINFRFEATTHQPNGLCVAPGCMVKPRSRTAQYCERHYYQVRRNGEILMAASPATVKLAAPIERYECCHHCGVAKPPSASKFCSKRCYTRAKRGVAATAKCKWCERQFTPINGKVCCSDKCRIEQDRRAARESRYETVSPAVRLLKCATCGDAITHMRRAGRPQTYCADCLLEIETRPTPPRELECVVCKAAFHAKDKRTKYCSRRCGRIARRAANPDAVRAEYLRSKQFEKARKALDPARLMKAARGDLVSAIKRLIANKDAAEKAARRCSVCGGSLGHRRQRYCSPKCYNKSEVTQSVRRRSAAAHRVAKRGVHAERIDPIAVFEAAGWRCQICSRSTPKRLRGTKDKRAPELDHVRPLSKGGTHTWSNVQCACRECNRWKSNRVVVGQIGLFSTLL